jgi:hypothetical protein
MIAARRLFVVRSKEKNAMKKLIPLMLGVALAVCSVAPTFAQEQQTTKSGKKKKGGKKKGTTEQPKANLR